MLAEGGYPRHSCSEDQRVDLVGAFISEYRFQVVHVPDDRVLEGDAVGAQDSPCAACDLQGFPDVVELSDAHLLWRKPSFVLHTPEVKGQQGSFADLYQHVDELFLRKLECGDRL